MANQVPIKKVGTSPNHSIGEFEDGDTTAIVHGGTGATTVTQMILNFGLMSATAITNALSGKSNTGHGHLEADITDLDKYTQQETNDLVNQSLSHPVDLSIINGSVMPTYIDSSQGNRVLSVANINFTFADAAIDTNDWMDIGNSNASDTCFVMPFDGTIVAWSTHVADDNGAVRDYVLYVGTSGNPTGTLFTTIGNNSGLFGDGVTTVDFLKGDQFRVRGGTQTGAAHRDSVVNLFVRWRKV